MVDGSHWTVILGRFFREGLFPLPYAWVFNPGTPLKYIQAHTLNYIPLCLSPGEESCICSAS